MPSYGTSGLQAAGARGISVPYGSPDVYASALGRERQAIAQTQGAARAGANTMASAGMNPFLAQRQMAQQQLQAQGQIQAQTNGLLEQRAEAERQRLEEERLRKEAQGRQMLAAGLSAAGGVLGTIVPGMGGLGSAAGGAIGGALGGR